MDISSNLKLRHFLLFGIGIFLLYLVKEAALLFLSRTDVVLFSPMEGKLTYEGKPAAHAKIVRHLIWKDEEGEKDVFYANEKGEFALPIRTEPVLIPPLAEFVIAQGITVYYANQEFVIWGRSKRDVEAYTELQGKPINFRCELTDEVEYIEVTEGLFGSSCKWDSIQSRTGYAE